MGPTIGLSGQAYWQHTDFGHEASTVLGQGGGSPGTGGGVVSTGTTSGGEPSSYNYGYAALTATQPLYTGGKVAAEVGAAEAAVAAGRQTLRATEANVLQAVVTAYEDVRRDAAVLRIRNEATTVLGSQAEETQAKFGVGQVNRVDVAQAQAQLAAARSLVASAPRPARHQPGRLPRRGGPGAGRAGRAAPACRAWRPAWTRPSTRRRPTAPPCCRPG